MSPDPTRDDELRELLSALVDGELDDAEAAEVRDLLERSEEARDELDGIVAVRALVRGHDQVEAPADFLATLVASPPSTAPTAAPTEPVIDPATEVARDDEHAAPVPISAARSARKRSVARRWLEIGGGAVAAAAVVVVLLGITPVTDRIAPPVEAYAARHDAMAADVAAAPPGTTVPTTAEPPGTAPGEAYTAVAPGEVDEAVAPAQLPMGYQRRAGYHSPTGVVQVVYVRGGDVVSVYVQPGRVAWDRLPAGGSKQHVGDDDVWVRPDGHEPDEEVLVVERELVVYTVVGAHQAMLEVVGAMPDPPAPGMPTRVRLWCRSVVDGIGLGD